MEGLLPVAGGFWESRAKGFWKPVAPVAEMPPAATPLRAQPASRIPSPWIPRILRQPAIILPCPCSTSCKPSVIRDDPARSRFPLHWHALILSFLETGGPEHVRIVEENRRNHFHVIRVGAVRPSGGLRHPAPIPSAGR